MLNHVLAFPSTFGQNGQTLQCFDGLQKLRQGTDSLAIIYAQGDTGDRRCVGLIFRKEATSVRYPESQATGFRRTQRRAPKILGEEHQRLSTISRACHLITFILKPTKIETRGLYQRIIRQIQVRWRRSKVKRSEAR